MSKFALFFIFLFTSAWVAAADDREDHSGSSDENNLYERNHDHLDFNPYDFPPCADDEEECAAKQSKPTKVHQPTK